MNNEKNNKTSRRPGKKAAYRDMLLELLYPPRCPICDEVLSGGHGFAMEQHGCCARCEERLPWVGEPACMKCGKPIEDEGQEYCGECRTQRHFFDRGVAAFTYTGAMRHSIYRMKAANRRDYLPFYAESMARALFPQLGRWRPEVIVPIPMHPRKRRRRGYNQSELLAVRLGTITGIPVAPDLLHCTRLVRSQKELGRQERLRNLRGSFSLSAAVSGISRVLLVDDVYTTGSTIDEVSRILRAGGVQAIFFVVLCTGKGKKGGMQSEKSMIYY